MNEDSIEDIGMPEDERPTKAIMSDNERLVEYLQARGMRPNLDEKRGPLIALGMMIYLRENGHPDIEAFVERFFQIRLNEMLENTKQMIDTARLAAPQQPGIIIPGMNGFPPAQPKNG
jgi:hypothetical protein